MATFRLDPPKQVHYPIKQSVIHLPPTLASAADSYPDVLGTVTITYPSTIKVRALNTADIAQVGTLNPGEKYHCIEIASNGWYTLVSYSGYVVYVDPAYCTWNNKSWRKYPGVYVLAHWHTHHFRIAFNHEGN